MLLELADVKGIVVMVVDVVELLELADAEGAVDPLVAVSLVAAVVGAMVPNMDDASEEMLDSAASCTPPQNPAREDLCDGK